MTKNTIFSECEYDDFFDPVDVLPFFPDADLETADQDVREMSRMIEQNFSSIRLLLIREYERTYLDGAMRQRVEIVRRSSAARCFTAAPLDRKARRELRVLEEDIKTVFSEEEQNMFFDFHKSLFALNHLRMLYTRKICENMTCKVLREWIAIVYDE